MSNIVGLFLPSERYPVPSAKAAWHIGFAIKCLQPNTLRICLAMIQHMQEEEHTTYRLGKSTGFVRYKIRLLEPVIGEPIGESTALSLL